MFHFKTDKYQTHKTLYNIFHKSTLLCVNGQTNVSCLFLLCVANLSFYVIVFTLRPVRSSKSHKVASLLFCVNSHTVWLAWSSISTPPSCLASEFDILFYCTKTEVNSTGKYSSQHLVEKKKKKKQRKPNYWQKLEEKNISWM